MNLEDIYTPLEEAKNEMERRWDNKDLKKKIDDFLGDNIPNFLMDSPKAYLARHVATPNNEFILFEQRARDTNLEYVIPEYLDDKFNSGNSLKYHLAKIYLHGGKGKNGGEKIKSETIIDFNISNGKPFREISTLWGQGLVNFHHELLKEHDINYINRIHDLSLWLKTKGGKPETFYLYFLALFIRNGVLFENFLINNEERLFTVENVLPNFKILIDKFGVKPLIVRLLPKETEEDIYWLCYNESINKYLKK